MKRRIVKRLFAGALAAALTLPLSACAAQTTVAVSPDNAITTNGGVFEGWGTSLCWWANRLGYSDSLAQQSADALFGEDGLRMNIMRYNIGGGDDPAHHHITRTDSEVPGWLVYNEAAQTYDFAPDADARQLNVLARSMQAAGEDALVEVFSNSPPYFMTNSGCSSGAANAKDNNLREDCVEAFADYLSRVTAYIQNDMGIPVYSLSPMNEPNTDYWQAMSWKQEGCHVDSGEKQSEIIEATAKAMARYGLDGVLLAASDETSPIKQLEAWRKYSAGAKAAVGRINTHTYSDRGAASLGKQMEKDGMNLWMSEVDGDGTAGTNAGEMGAALWLGEKIISDINALRPSAWVMWQAIDNHISAEGMNGNKDYGMVNPLGGFWGVAIADHDNDDIILTQKYYGLGQFTRYIRPGSTLMRCGKQALAAYDEANGTLALVMLNTDGKDRTVTADVRGIGAAFDRAQAFRTSGAMDGGEHWAQLPSLPVSEGRTEVVLKANSITTLVFE